MTTTKFRTEVGLYGPDGQPLTPTIGRQAKLRLAKILRSPLLPIAIFFGAILAGAGYFGGSSSAEDIEIDAILEEQTDSNRGNKPAIKTNPRTAGLRT